MVTKVRTKEIDIAAAWERLEPLGWRETREGVLARTWNLAEVDSENRYFEEYKTPYAYINPLYIRHELNFNNRSFKSYVGTTDRDPTYTSFGFDILYDAYITQANQCFREVAPLRYRVLVGEIERETVGSMALVQTIQPFKSVTFSAQEGEYLICSREGNSHKAFYRVSEDEACEIIEREEVSVDIFRACRNQAHKVMNFNRITKPEPMTFGAANRSMNTNTPVGKGTSIGIVYTFVMEQLRARGWQEIGEKVFAKSWNLAELGSKGDYKKSKFSRAFVDRFYVNPLCIRYELDFNVKTVKEYVGTADQDPENAGFRLLKDLPEDYLFFEDGDDPFLWEVEPLRYRLLKMDGSHSSAALLQVTHPFKSAVFSAKVDDYLLRSPAGDSHNTFFLVSEERAQKILSREESVIDACHEFERLRRKKLIFGKKLNR